MLLAGSFQACINADMPPPNEWQFVDNNGFVYPWFTMPFLEVLETWDMQDWELFEYGAGHSTVWFANRCKSVVSADHNPGWLDCIDARLKELNLDNVTLKYRKPTLPLSIGEGGEESELVNSIDEDDKLYDCIVIDCEYHRNTCAEHILSHIKPGGIIILDNANQASVGLNSTRTFEILKDYEHFSFKQPNHGDWRTDFWIIR